MKYCPNCQTEYVDTIDTCTDCQTSLVSDKEWAAVLSQEEQSRLALRDEELEPACSVSGPVEAQSLLAALEQEGIPALLRSYQDTAFDGLFVASSGWGQIWVAGSRLTEAQQLIDALRASTMPELDDESDDDE